MEQYIQAGADGGPVPVMAALVNGELRELTYPVWSDARVDPVLLSDSDGVRIYRRSLSFLLVTVVRELFPQVQVFVDHTLPFGGFFCQVQGREPFGPEELVLESGPSNPGGVMRGRTESSQPPSGIGHLRGGPGVFRARPRGN